MLALCSHTPFCWPSIKSSRNPLLCPCNKKSAERTPIHLVLWVDTSHLQGTCSFKEYCAYTSCLTGDAHITWLVPQVPNQLWDHLKQLRRRFFLSSWKVWGRWVGKVLLYKIRVNLNPLLCPCNKKSAERTPIHLVLWVDTSHLRGTCSFKEYCAYTSCLTGDAHITWLVLQVPNQLWDRLKQLRRRFFLSN